MPGNPKDYQVIYTAYYPLTLLAGYSRCAEHEALVLVTNKAKGLDCQTYPAMELTSLFRCALKTC